MSETGVPPAIQLAISELISEARGFQTDLALGHDEASCGYSLVEARAKLFAAIERQLRASQEEAGRLTAVIRWALGEEGEFPLWDDGGESSRRPGDGNHPRIGYFWWRTELRQRAFGQPLLPSGDPERTPT